MKHTKCYFRSPNLQDRTTPFLKTTLGEATGFMNMSSGMQSCCNFLLIAVKEHLHLDKYWISYQLLGGDLVVFKVRNLCMSFWMSGTFVSTWHLKL